MSTHFRILPCKIACWEVSQTLGTERSDKRISGRKRTVQIKFYVTEEERDLIAEKMKLIPTRNMAVTKIKPIKSTLSKALDYIQNPDKTDEKILVSSFGCSYETADIEFEFTIAQALDKGNNLAHHLIQSFAPGEVDYEKAHEIGRQLADAVTKGQHEYVLTTHINKGHIHNHIIFCAVNFVDYHKYNSNKRSYYGIRNISDRLCRENGRAVCGRSGERQQRKKLCRISSRKDRDKLERQT